MMVCRLSFFKYFGDRVFRTPDNLHWKTWCFGNLGASVPRHLNLGTSVTMMVQSKISVARFAARYIVTVNLAYKCSWNTSNCIAGFVKQVVPLWPQNRVWHPKGDLPTAPHRGDFIAVSPCEKGKRSINQLKFYDMKHLKTKYVKVRVTAEEAALIKENQRATPL